MASTKAQIAASARYNTANCRQFKLMLNKQTDAEIIAKLESVDNIQGYIKSLIREDIAKN